MSIFKEKKNLIDKNIFVNDFDGAYGKFINVKIERVEGFNLFGKII